jgi:hypothetical protein
MANNSELLTGLTIDELEALADGLLAPSAQSRLDDLLARSRESELHPDEQAELESLLQKVDQLTLLKTRARYTLYQQGAKAAGS